MACKAHKKAGTRACPVSVLRWRASRDSDPQLRIPAQQVSLWAEIWEDTLKDLSPNAWRTETKITQAWRKLAEQPNDKRTSKGPVSTTINMLTEIGWVPLEPGKWGSQNKRYQTTIGTPRA